MHRHSSKVHMIVILVNISPEPKKEIKIYFNKKMYNQFINFYLTYSLKLPIIFIEANNCLNILSRLCVS